jgi:glycosyltransferase involved in cell wall biosynthesis
MSLSSEISVVIPSYNRSEELNRSLNTVVEQTVQPLEVFVIDDCSEDDLGIIVDAFKAKLNIQLIRLVEKGNANVARNKGIELASGKFIALLDSDDEWKSNHLENSIKFITENEIDGCFGGIQILKNGNPDRLIVPRDKYNNESPVEYLFGDGLCSTPTILISTEVARQIQFDNTLERHQDLDFSIRVFDAGFKFMSTKSCTTVVHWNSEGTRKVNLSASKKFMTKHHSGFTPKLYFEYHRNMFHACKSMNNMDIAALKYYGDEARQSASNLASYFSIDEPNSYLTKLIAAFKFYTRKSR